MRVFSRACDIILDYFMDLGNGHVRRETDFSERHFFSETHRKRYRKIIAGMQPVSKDISVKLRKLRACPNQSGDDSLKHRIIFTILLFVFYEPQHIFGINRKLSPAVRAGSFRHYKSVKPILHIIYFLASDIFVFHVSLRKSC